jgi:hypothetical protein
VLFCVFCSSFGLVVFLGVGIASRSRAVGGFKTRCGVELCLNQRVQPIFGAKVLSKVSLSFNTSQMPRSMMRGHWHERKRNICEACRTGIPELVLMPAPVTTTTFRALKSALATSCRCSPDTGWTCCVGMIEAAQLTAAELQKASKRVS